MQVAPLSKCIALFFIVVLAACAPIESHQALEPHQVQAPSTEVYQEKKASLVVGDFNNRSNYLQGMFSSGKDPLGHQAKTLLKTHLQQSQRFLVVDRDNLLQAKEEAARLGVQQKIQGARYVVAGTVTEFGRKEIGDRQLFGIFGQGKTQQAYAVVTLNIVDVLSSAVIYATQGAGEYALSQREVLGFGSRAGYDATLNGKVLNLAIVQAVEKLSAAVASGALSIE